MFSPEALQRQAKAKWNRITREADSKTNTELANLLAEDDDLNFTDEPTLDKVIAQHNSQKNKDESNPLVSVQVPAFPTEHTPSMNPIEISVSTFHPGPTINLTDDPDSDEESNNNKSSQKSPVSILRTYRVQEADMISRISMSDSATRISSLETEISTMDKTFRDEIGKLQSQAAQQAHAQLEHGTILSEILSTLMKTNLASLIDKQTPERSGGSPTKLGKLKEDNIRQGIQKWEFDIFGMAETNLDWRMLSELEKLPHRTKEWWEHQHISLVNVSIPLISALKGTLQGVSRRSPGRTHPRELGRYGLTRQPYGRTRQPEG
jgi:hypothetical protein